MALRLLQFSFLMKVVACNLLRSVLRYATLVHHDEGSIALGRAVDHVHDEILDLVRWILDENYVGLVVHLDEVGLGRAIDHVLDEILDLVCWSQDEVHVDLECVIDHVLGEILAHWFICDGLALLVRWETLSWCMQSAIGPT